MAEVLVKQSALIRWQKSRDTDNQPESTLLVSFDRIIMTIKSIKRSHTEL